MLLANIKISKTTAKVTAVEPITAGLIDATVTVEFDATWKDYNKVYVWSGNNQVIVDTKTTGIIPAEVVANPKSELKFGVYGVKGDEATPTIWANLGFVRPGADPSGDESTDPSLPVWAQLQEQIAKLNGADPEEVKKIIEDYLADAGPKPIISAVDLMADAWVGSGNLHSQVVSIDGVTESSRVDLTPTVEQLADFLYRELALVAENEGGIVTVYAVGERPANDYTIPVTITEVDA